MTGHCVDCPESLFSVLSKYLHVTHVAFHWTYPACLHLTWIWTLETFCPFQLTYYIVKQKKTLLFTYNTIHSQCCQRIRAGLGPRQSLPVKSILIHVWTKQHLKGWHWPSSVPSIFKLFPRTSYAVHSVKNILLLALVTRSGPREVRITVLISTSAVPLSYYNLWAEIW